MNRNESRMRVWRAKQLTPDERIEKLLSLCVYATLVVVLLLIGGIGEAMTIYTYIVHGVPSHPLHPVWVDAVALAMIIVGITFLAFGVGIWLNEAQAIRRADKTFEGNPPP